MTEHFQQAIDGLVAHLFRHQAGQIMAVLTRRLGAHRIDLAEDIVQETLVRALRQWPLRGVPENPSGWLMQTANNLMIDLIRREKSFAAKEATIASHCEARPSTDETGSVRYEQEVSDDQLAMIFAACHPSLSSGASVAFTLKILCGFSVPEISRAFLLEESTIAQRIVRAKRLFRSGRVALEIPPAAALVERLGPVMHVLYLLFNEGYNCHSGEQLVREDLCEEAIRLTRLLAAHPRTDQPSVHALLALMLFQASRLPARADDGGNLLLLKYQDRCRWDCSLIGDGFRELEQAAHGTELTRYHLEAGIASIHASAVSFESTDWKAMRQLYDDLAALVPSPIILLNRSVVTAMIDGPGCALAELEGLTDHSSFRSFHLFFSTRAEFKRRLGDWPSAIQDYERAIALAGNDAERRFLSEQATKCRHQAS